MSNYLEYFDFDAFPGNDGYTLDLDDLDITAPIGQEEQNPAIDFEFSLLPDATAATVEPVSFPIRRALNWSTTSGAYGGSQEPAVQSDSNAGLQNHHQKLEVIEHHRVGATRNSCPTCGVSFSTSYDLDEHGRSESHSIYKCSCEKEFTRPDALRRHLKSFSGKLPQFHCTFCKRHRGKHGFHRRDHLLEHLKRYHKFDAKEIGEVCPPKRHEYNDYPIVCPLRGCEFHRGEEEFSRLTRHEQQDQAPFQRRSDYNKHLKDAHKATPYPCPVAGCDRVEAKGYMTDKGLMGHLAREHPNAPQHLTKLREGLKTRSHKCDQCGKEIRDLGDFNIHCRLVHQL